MLRTIIAIERDGFDVRTLAINFIVPSKDFDLITAIKNASTEFCKTEYGKGIYEYNCNCFNWADFVANVPNELCKKHGFEMLNSEYGDMEVDWDEQLVDEIEMEDDE